MTMDTSVDMEAFSVSILELIKTSQMQNGLRHGDYMRYRQYCTRRLRRIRKSIKFTHGKGKQFLPKQVDAENAQEVEFLLIPLFNAERAWSYAMQLREDEKNDKDEYGDDGNSRLKFHLASRLAKAASWSKQLLELCAKKADARTSLEAEAYAGYMVGNLSLYREEWNLALQSFGTARRIYTELSKVGTLEQRDLLQQILEEINPYVRYCEYNLNALGEMGDANANAALLDLTEGSTSSFLQSKLDKVFKDAAIKQAETMGEISWRGKSIPVRTEQLRVAILRPNEQISMLESLTDSDSDEKRETLSFEIIRHYDNALRQLRTEQDKFSDMKSGQLVDAQRQELQALEHYVRYMKLRQLTNRNLVIMCQVERRLEAGKENDNEETTVPEDMVHILDMIIQNIEEMQCIPGTDDDAEAGLECNAKHCTFSALRCYYLAEACIPTGKFNEANALYERSLSQAALAQELNAKRGSTGAEDQSYITGLREKVIAAKSRAIATSYLDSIAMQTELSNQLASAVNLSSTRGRREKKRRLMDRLSDFSAGHPRRNYDLIDIPPDMEAVPCKPLFFDVAYNALSFPDISHRMSTAEQLEEKKKAAEESSSSSASGFFGWLRGN